MELQLKQWRSNESEQQLQPSAKFPKLLLSSPQQGQQQEYQQSQTGALPFFSSEPNTRISSSLSDNPSSRFPRMGSLFSLAQWQELELQALIYRYMLAGVAVPPELLQPIKKSLLHSPSCFLHHSLHQHPHFQPSFMDTGFWGRPGMELEPGRCRRTDGKKWRCARDVVAGHKYCDRHMHRGRSRSRKPVELSTPNTAASRSRATTFLAASVPGDATRFGFSESSNPNTIQLLQPNHSPLETKPEHKGLLQAPNGANRSDGHILRPFFDDWPRSQKTDNSNGSNTGPINSGTALSISMPGNLSSDVSLKLCTGNGEELRLGDNGREPQGWAGGWTANQVASMGGPLAEALRSSTNSSPTSVLHQLARGSASETGYVGA